MAVLRKYKTESRNRFERRKRRTKGSLATRDLPVLMIRKTNSHLYATVTNPNGAETIASISTAHPSLADKVSKGVKRKESATLLGSSIAASLKDKGIKQVAFNRNGYLYHGVVAAFAQSVRDSGITI